MRQLSINIILILISSFIFSISTLSHAKTADPYEEDRQQLLNIMSTIEKSINNKDVNNITKLLHPNAVITFHDATVAKGVDSIEGYFQDKLGGSTPVLKSYSTKAFVDGPANFYGNVAIAYGHSIDSFVFVTGNEFELESKWTVTLNKNNDMWSVVALHFSINMFENPLLTSVKNNLILSSLIAFLVGIFLTYLLYRLYLRKKYK